MAEEFKHIDEIIRQKFENFEPEPPIQMWEKIQSGLQKTPPPSSPGILLPIIISVSLLFFISGLFYHHYTTKDDTLNASTDGITIHSASLGSTGSTTISDNTLQEEFSQSTPEIPQAIAAADEPVVNSIPVRVPPVEQKSSADKKKKNTKADKKAIQAEKQTRTAQYRPGLVQALKSGELSAGEAKNFGLTDRDYRKLNSYREAAKAKVAEWSLGLYFNPEATISNDESIDNTISYNVSLLPQVSFNRFFIQSGVNARFNHDKGNMTVDYNRYLGSYEDVYLVTFDTIDHVIVPTYHTNTVDVWDTITHYSVAETKAGYTYLEVPVLFGYSYSLGKVSLFAKAGPSASFMVGKHIPDAGNPEDNAKIINVAYQVPVRNTINWQMMMGAGIDYKLSNKISFSLEPTFRFALNPEYDMTGINGKTKSFGIKAGLNYKF